MGLNIKRKEETTVFLLHSIHSINVVQIPAFFFYQSFPHDFCPSNFPLSEHRSHSFSVPSNLELDYPQSHSFIISLMETML